MGIEEPILFLFFSIFDLLKLALFLSIIGIILYKIFTPVINKIMDKYELTWVKSIFLLNLVVIFVVLEIIYLYFYFFGLFNAPVFDLELQPTIMDIFLAIVFDAVRVFIASFIIALIFLLVEFISSSAISYQKEKKYSELAKQFIGILVGVTIVLAIGLLFFEWVPLGLFVYIFYGGVNPVPVFALIPTPILSIIGAIL